MCPFMQYLSRLVLLMTGEFIREALAPSIDNVDETLAE